MTKTRAMNAEGTTTVPCSKSSIFVPAPLNQAGQLVSMTKSSKVVPFPSAEAQFIASDEESRRVIVGIGSQRMAFDFFTRVTELSPSTGDGSATVLPMKKRRKQSGASRTRQNRTT